MGSTKTENDWTNRTPYVDLWSTLHSLQVKTIIGNVTAKNYLKERLSCILCFIIQGKGSSWKRFDPEIYCCNIAHIWHDWVSSLHARNEVEGVLPLIANMLFVSKNCSLEKVAFMNSSCFMICELNWIVFMAIVKHFLVKMRLASFWCVNLIKSWVCRLPRNLDFHSQNQYLQNLLFA